MPKKRFNPQQIVTLLRQIEVTMGRVKSSQHARGEAGISEQYFYRWRKEYGGLDLDQARRMKDLEKENARPKWLVADLSLEKHALKDISSGNLQAPNVTCRWLSGSGRIISFRNARPADRRPAAWHAELYGHRPCR